MDATSRRAGVHRDSRVQSTGLLAQAITEVRQPPPVLVKSVRQSGGTAIAATRS